MVPSRRSYILFCFLSFLLVACRPTPEPVTAGPRFNVTPGVADSRALVYEDTSSAYYQEIIQKLDAFYATQVRGGFNGSVLIAQKGKIIYERYFGYANREQGLRLAPNVPSQLASVSKTFTGAAVLYLYQNKYLDINAPVQQYLPEFPYSGITIKMLLNHRSGIPYYQKWS